MNIIFNTDFQYKNILHAKPFYNKAITTNQDGSFGKVRTATNSNSPAIYYVRKDVH
ncbi:MAG: hypothetical protein L3J41_02440 [Melioribacteraceae bacterium]|nr:hypothetical protein [Melioribacteraceae bacterium]